MFHKISISLLILSIIFFFGLVAYKNAQPKRAIAVEQIGPIEKDSPFAKISGPFYFEPVELSVENVGIKIDLSQVHIETDGSLGVPAEWNEGGWFSKSAKPGQIGTMVIDGHYDDSSGKPAAFWNLKNVKVNDTVVVHDELGRDFSYEVIEIFYIDINDPDRLEIFENESDSSELILITCGGVWLPDIVTYNNRLVVRAVLVL